jgi:hypothetical protein
MKEECQLTADDCNRIKVELMSALSGLFVYADTVSLTAANQLLRTNVDPKIYNTVARLNRYIDKNPKRIRLLAEKLGYSDWFSEEAQSIVAPVIDIYQHSSHYNFDTADITRHDLAQCYLELLSIAALYDDQLLKDFATAVFSILTHEYIHSNTQAFHHHLGAEQRTIQQLQEAVHRLARHDARLQYSPHIRGHEHDDIIEPIHAHIHHNNALAALRIPLAITLHDALIDSYSIAYGDPQFVQRHTIHDRVHLPLEQIRGTGLAMHVLFDPETSSDPLQFFLNTDLLDAIRDNGSAVGAVIGVHGDIQLHPEYLNERHHEQPIARVRVNHAILEIQKLHPDSELTLFV